MTNSANRPANPVWSIPPAWPGGGSTAAATPAPIVATVVGIGIVLAIAAPWLIHLAPLAGGPLGPVLLPIFYAPMMAALMLRLPMAVAVSVVAPIASQYLTGMPPDAVLPSLMLQIAAFVIAIRVLRALPWVVVVPAAYIVGLVSAALVAQAVGVTTIDVASTIQAGWPGIAVLTVLGLVADRLLRRSTP